MTTEIGRDRTERADALKTLPTQESSRWISADLA